MTVYCPECGKPNTDQATSCASCGYELKKRPSRSGRRFKGTMIMGNIGQAAHSRESDDTDKPESEAPPAADAPEPPAAEPPPAPRPKIPSRGKFKQTILMGSPASQQDLPAPAAEPAPEPAAEPAAELEPAAASAGAPFSEERWSTQPDLVIPTRRNTNLWWGLGCLTFIVLSCVVATWWGGRKGVEHVMEAGGQAAVEISRATLVAALVEARDHCRAGKPGPRRPDSIHPSASDEACNLLCTVDETVMQKLMHRDESRARVYEPVGDDDPILALPGINPERCFEYDVDALHIVGCRSDSAAKLKIVDVTTRR